MARLNRFGKWHGLRDWGQCVESFWRQVVKTESCWVWTGNKNKTGYGQYKMPGHSYRTHRASWQMAFGPIPKGMQVLHHCDNPSCVNPDHLFLGTHKDNMADCAAKGRIVLPNQVGENHSGHKLTEEEVRQIKGLLNQCSHAQISKMYGISRSVVTRIALKQLWAHVE